MLAVELRMAESSRLPEVGEVPHQPERHIFPRRQFGKSKVVGRAFQESGFTRLAFVSGGAQDTIFFFYMMLTKTGTAMAVPAVVAPTGLRPG